MNKQKKNLLQKIIVSYILLAMPIQPILAMPNKSEVKQTISDSTITATINTKFLADSQIKSLELKVDTKDGQVEISGNVPDEETKDHVLTIAREINGVKGVNLKLDIKPMSKPENIASDSEITATIKAKYLADSDIKGFRIHVETVNGVVNLTGQVKNDTIKDKAVAIAKATEGVKEVKYDFTITPNTSNKP